jgi:uncharacterized protein YdeI (YjbR/CyaY-like superfamily)
MERKMGEMNPKVDSYFDKAEKWQAESRKLRTIVLECDLVEELKWGVPCYTFAKKNIVVIHGFKEYCALLFLKGALLKDPAGILIQQTKNVQAARQARFTGVREIVKLRGTLKDYIRAAIEVEKAGKKVPLKKVSEFAVPAEFRRELDRDPALKRAFEALTPGRQRGYLLYFSAPKQSKTREARIEKSMDRILDGMGLND